MDTTLFQSQLSLNLGDPSNTTYSATLVQTAMCLAVRAYRRYRNLLRTFGNGNSYSQALSGQATMNVCGGPWVVGNSYQITSQYGVTETQTLLDIGAGTPIPNWMGTPLLLTFSNNLTNTYPAGSTIQSTTPGMAIVSGQMYYALPLDFVTFDQLTWNLANGRQRQARQFESFYDGAYVFSQALSGVGWGQSQTFSSGSGFGGWGPVFVGIPNASNAFVLPQGSTIEAVLEVQPGNPPMLYYAPAPQVNQTWVFNYRAAHQPETVPDEDFDAVMDAARLICTEAQGQILAGMLDARDIRQDMMPSHNAKALMDVADKALEIFNQKILRRPFFVMG